MISINRTITRAARLAAITTVAGAVLFGLGGQAQPAAAQTFTAPPAPGTPTYGVSYVDLLPGNTYVKQFQNGPYMLFEVKNTGNVAAAPFQVVVKSGSGIVLQSYNMPAGMVAGGTVLLTHRLPDCYLNSSSAVRIIEVDSGHVVNEINENNNTKGFTDPNFRTCPPQG
ncbi:MAG: CARDB domain-containing protein [Dehalococcoidia bacterium]